MIYFDYQGSKAPGITQEDFRLFRKALEMRKFRVNLLGLPRVVSNRSFHYAYDGNKETFTCLKMEDGLVLVLYEW
jgi:hypothetical protein